MTTATGQLHRLTTVGRDGGGDSDGDRDRNSASPCLLISSFSHLEGFQDFLNDRQQAKKDLRHTQCGHTGIASKCGTVGTDATKQMDESKAVRMPRRGRRFRPRARGEDFRQNMFVPGVGAPLMMVSTETKRAGISWNAQVYKPEFPITKQEEEYDHEQQEQQPKTRFQALDDHNLDQGMPPPSPILYDSYTTTTSSPCSDAPQQATRGGRRLDRQASIGECQPAPFYPYFFSKDASDHTGGLQEMQQPRHMLSMSCSTMMTEDDDSIASFFIPDDDLSEVTWEGDFHKHQQHQQHQQQQQQQQQQTRKKSGKKNVPSWTSRFLRPSRDVKSVAVATDGVTTTAAALHTSISIPSCITVALAHRS
jgi:hypothetical protein